MRNLPAVPQNGLEYPTYAPRPAVARLGQLGQTDRQTERRTDRGIA